MRVSLVKASQMVTLHSTEQGCRILPLQGEALQRRVTQYLVNIRMILHSLFSGYQTHSSLPSSHSRTHLLLPRGHNPKLPSRHCSELKVQDLCQSTSLSRAGLDTPPLDGDTKEITRQVTCFHTQSQYATGDRDTINTLIWKEKHGRHTGVTDPCHFKVPPGDIVSSPFPKGGEYSLTSPTDCFPWEQLSAPLFSLAPGSAHRPEL